MRYIILFLLFLSVASSQVYGPDSAPTDAVQFETRIRFNDLVGDSALVLELPAFVALTEMYVIIDTALVSSGGTDSVKIGISGERTTTPHRFADFKIDSIGVGEIMEVSHKQYRQTVAGMLYTYDGTLDVNTGDAETYTPIQSFSMFPRTDFDVTNAGAMRVRAYRDGIYEVSVNLAFGANAANVTAHAELFRNGQPYDYISFERTITTASQIGAASMSGEIRLAEGDSLKVYLKSSGTNTTYTIEHGQFTLTKLQDGQPYVTNKIRRIYLYCDAATGQIRVITKYRRIL